MIYYVPILMKFELVSITCVIIFNGSIHSLACFQSPPHAVPVLIGVLVAVASIMLVIVLLATFLICYVWKRFHCLAQRPMTHEPLPTQAGRLPVSIANYIIWKDSF